VAVLVKLVLALGFTIEDLMKEDTIIYSYDVAKSPESLEMPSLGRVQALFMHELAFDLFSRYFPVYLWKVS